MSRLENEPERRYQHVSEVKTAVESIAAGGGRPPVGSRAGSGNGHWRNQVVLALVCSFLQILGLISIIAFELPVITGIAGFAAIVHHLAVKKEGWVGQLSLIAAICGFFLILMAIAASVS